VVGGFGIRGGDEVGRWAGFRQVGTRVVGGFGIRGGDEVGRWAGFRQVGTRVVGGFGIRGGDEVGRWAGFRQVGTRVVGGFGIRGGDEVGRWAGFRQVGTRVVGWLGIRGGGEGCVVAGSVVGSPCPGLAFLSSAGLSVWRGGRAGRRPLWCQVAWLTGPGWEVSGVFSVERLPAFGSLSVGHPEAQTKGDPPRCPPYPAAHPTTQ
jgi:hypothetical protein